MSNNKNKSQRGTDRTKFGNTSRHWKRKIASKGKPSGGSESIRNIPVVIDDSDIVRSTDRAVLIRVKVSVLEDSKWIESDVDKWIPKACIRAGFIKSLWFRNSCADSLRKGICSGKKAFLIFKQVKIGKTGSIEVLADSEDDRQRLMALVAAEKGLQVSSKPRPIKAKPTPFKVSSGTKRERELKRLSFGS